MNTFVIAQEQINTRRMLVSQARDLDDQAARLNEQDERIKNLEKAIAELKTKQAHAANPWSTEPLTF